MRVFLGVLAVVLNLADNLTTFWCLRAPVPGFEVTEANPFAAWLFEAVGLRQGLALEMVISTLAIAFLVETGRIPPRAKVALLAVLALLPGWAALNNLEVMHATGIEISWS